MKLKRDIETQDIIRFVGIAVVLGLLVWGGVFYARTFMVAGDQSGNFIENMQSSGLYLREFIVNTQPGWGFVLMMLLQIIPVIVSVVPSSLTSLVGGMIYGFWGGMALTIVGSAIGATISFYLARILGRRVLTLFVSRKTIAKVEGLLDGNASTLVLLFLYAIPSPKDFFSYFLGLSSMSYWKFILISTVGRIPGMVVTVYFGTLALGESPNWVLMGVVGALAAVVSVLVLVFSKRITGFLKQKEETAVEDTETSA
ncbi:MAG: VTT domain-containing protein [Oscillospiraceae bacterium]|nr:VTT domain-containing protein [Oscillospiraceae bacterium]